MNYSPKPIPFIVSKSLIWITYFLVPLGLLILIASETSIIHWVATQHLNILISVTGIYSLLVLSTVAYSSFHYYITIDPHLKQCYIKRKLPGIIFNDMLPLNKIASIKTTSTLIDRIQQTASLHLLSESAYSASITLPNLSVKDINSLREQISNGQQS